MGLGIVLGEWVVAFGAVRIDLADAVLRLAAVAAAYAAFTWGQRFLRRVPLLRSIGLQLNLFVLCLLLLLFMAEVLGRAHAYALTSVVAAAVFLGTTIALKILDVALFDGIARWRQATPVPLVLRDIGRLLVALVALVLIVRGFFPGVNLNVLAVSSLVVGYVVGNATQDTLGNLISGLALNAERPFQIGDWVMVNGHVGVVVDTTWRATRLKTKAEDYIVLPNSAIAKEPIINYSRPTRSHGCYLTVGVSYETPPNKARAAIQAVLAGIPDVLKEPAPSVYLDAYGDSAINFRIKFFIADYARIDPIQSLVMDRLWYGFRREGINIPFPIRDVRWRDAGADEARQAAVDRAEVRLLLAGVDLLRSLKPEEMDRLAQGAAKLAYAAGEVLFHQGDPGETLYVVRHGRVAVSVKGGEGRDVAVAQLAAGAFFGEMSLLTGEPRSATIRADTDTQVLAVSKALIGDLLQTDPDLAARLAAVLEARQADRQAKLAAQAGVGAAAAVREPVLVRMRRFFGMA